MSRTFMSNDVFYFHLNDMSKDTIDDRDRFVTTAKLMQDRDANKSASMVRTRFAKGQAPRQPSLVGILGSAQGAQPARSKSRLTRADLIARDAASQSRSQIREVSEQNKASNS